MAIKFYTINEDVARRAKEANSFYDYVPNSATNEYQKMVTDAYNLAEKQKQRVSEEYHEKIDHLVDKYAYLLASNMNKGFEITARVPSVMIAGSSNFPVRKKEKQNQAHTKNMQDWKKIQKILEKIESVGMRGIRSDDKNAIKKLQAELKHLEDSQQLIHKNIESNKGWVGFIKKIIEFFVVAMAFGLQKILNNSIPLRDIAVIFYLCNEGISIIENAAACGVPVPERIKDVLLQLKDKPELNQKGDENE